MSMPAISAGKVYMAFPDSKGDHQHRLACFELRTGKEFWKRPIAGEVITAPIVTDEKVYVSTIDGTVYCFGQHDGELVWKEKKNPVPGRAEESLKDRRLLPIFFACILRILYSSYGIHIP